jgi:ribosomal-protein-alanine N-acetyltransferase
MQNQLPAAFARGPRLQIRPPAPIDEPALIAANHASIALHHPWISPPLTSEAFAGYLERCARPENCGMLICRNADGAILGAITLSQIFYGPLCSAYAGYYICAPYAGQGYMKEALELALNYAFGPLGLHRIEANIQPGNAPSIALVRRLGFTQEGFSRRYLRIDGDWRDHERWAMLSEDWGFRQSQHPAHT